MEIIFEIVFQIFFELILQLVFEVLAEVGLHHFRRENRPPPRVSFAILGYALMGALAGGLSLLLFPELFLDTPRARAMNLIFLPVLAGVVMATLGAWRQRRDQDVIRLDRFAYGYLFALTMALVRFFFGGR
jgi:uncharacterized membrane protein